MISLLKAMLGMGGESIGPREAVQRMNAGAVLVDVREPHEFDAGHAPQAKTLPLGRISAQGAVAIDALYLPQECCEVLLICQSGMRSRMARNALRSDARRRYVNVTGGMAAWMAAGLPCRARTRS